MKTKMISRRNFIRYSTIVSTGIIAAPYFVRGQNLNEKIRVACIGVGGKGDSPDFIHKISKTPEISGT